MRQIIDDRVQFTPGMTRATRAFARSKPWQGTVAERAEKFRTFHEAVIAENDLHDVALIVQEDTITDEIGASGNSQVIHVGPDGLPADEPTNQFAIVLAGRLSVVTYLYLVGALLGYSRQAAMRFAINLFKQRFPRSFAGCRLIDGMCVR